ncbi:Dipeptidyl aminopeptidase BII [Saliniradius amylolyticus]|uniref:Dipeptidyl-peptidase n=1 Tax=Saliniradius amylolyticus TaxID=2183582 RepID=A0A2S2E3K2_9ALTE|nr:S46 family peptidase [Saliniradius amylolyticus]AWL12225.1 Dipeptidyl aminopeptidase BII [Saliniradius amylolyticus]
MKKFTSALLLMLSFTASADEGMWQPHQLPELESILKQKGLEIDPKNISKLTEFPMNAVISLGGCTASFVSPKGLVVTNHHCAYGSIQYNSTPENNYLENGFLAGALQQELPAAPGSRMYVTEEVTDVTASIKEDLDEDLSGQQRYQLIDQRSKSLVSECEQDEGYRCEVYSFHGGLEYYLIKALEIRDVRLVYAPSMSVGKYGGDIDNWMWPRQTGDFSFYRAYVGPDGQPADYSEDNKPFTPPSFLKVSAKGVERGDFVMVAGYPGRTNRYRTADEVEAAFTYSYPTAKQYREEMIDVIKTTAPEGSDARIKYESTIAGLANYAKNYGSMIQSYERSGFQQQKQAFENGLMDWLNQSEARLAHFGGAIDELQALIEAEQAHQQRDLAMGYINRTALLPTAQRLYRLAHERQKPDMERESGYQQRDMKRFEQSMTRLSRRFDAEVDKAVLLHFIKNYQQLPESQHIAEFDAFFGLGDGFDEAKLRDKLNAMYANTELDEEDARLKWMNASVEAFKNSDDPFIQYAVTMYDKAMTMEAEEKERSGQFQALRPAYMEAVIAYMESLGKPVYADANSTLRVTYGNVKGYSPKDGVYMTPFTSLRGLLQKETGEEPFNSPDKLLKLADKEFHGGYELESLDSVPVNFLSTVDTTGGNSGSATMNGKAELVGLLFDGVYESIIGDWHFDDNLNRSIHVDSRYMLYIMEHVDEADNLLEEMVIVE